MSEAQPEKKLGVATRIGVIVVLLLIGAGIAALLIKMKPEPEKAEQQVEGQLVEAIPARLQTVTMKVAAYGTVEARRQVTEVAEVMGRVVMMSPQLEEGMFFRKGDVLMQIDPRSYHLTVTRLAAQLDASKAELNRLRLEQESNEKNLELASQDTALAERELQRQTNLLATNAVAEVAVETARRAALAARQQQQRIENTLSALKAQLAAAEAQVAMAEANLAEAQLNLDKTTIKAPFDGRTMEKLVDEGQFVTAGQRLASIYDTSAVEVTVNLPFDDLQWLDLSAVTRPLLSTMPDAITTSSLPLPRAVATLDAAGPAYRWEGYVSRVAGVVDRQTRTVPVIVAFSDPWSAFEQSSSSLPPLVPGMFVRVQIEGRQYSDVVEIPRSALRDSDTVFIVNSDILRVRQAQVLRTMDNLAYLSAGVTPGDLIITSPMSAGVDGAKIRIAAERTPAAPPLESQGASSTAP